MELAHLRSFYLVAREGGFTRASKVAHVQQPALSRSVRLLEEDLGVTLLERQRRATVLTKVGREIFTVCARIFEDTESIRALAEEEQTECKGALRFAAASAISTCLVPNTLASYLAEHPDVWPMTFSGTAAGLVERIASTELEFGLFFHLPQLPASLRETVLRRVPFKIVIAARKAKDPRARNCFIGSREVDDATNARYPTVERLRRDNPTLRIGISTNDMSAHRQMVLLGLGISILPEFLVADDLRRGRMRSLHDREVFRFPLCLVTRDRQVLSRVAQRFLVHIERALDA